MILATNFNHAIFLFVVVISLSVDGFQLFSPTVFSKHCSSKPCNVLAMVSNFDDIRTSFDDFDQIIESISIFKKLYKDIRIPLKFEVPAENPWPYHLHGLRLGKRLEKILSTTEFYEQSEKVKKLEDLGFKPDPTSLVDEWDVILDALKRYYAIHGDLRVPVKFVVPDEGDWPRLSRGLKLGLRVASIRSAGRYIKENQERKSQLDELGFEWRVREHTHKQQLDEDNFDKIYEALKLYKKIFGEVEFIPVNFVVPQSEEWPEHLWNLKLGLHFQSIRENEKYFFNNDDKKLKLSELGIEMNKKSDRASYTKKRFDMVYDALAIYKKLYDDLLVPQAFSVPFGNSDWPEELWGLKLGVRVSAIRCQGVLIASHPDRRDLLNDLGFVWDINNSTVKKRKVSKSDNNYLLTGDDSELSVEDVEKEKRVEENIAKRKLAISLQKLDDKTAKSVKSETEPLEREPAFESFETDNRNSRRNFKFEFAKMFEPSPYREIAAESIREYMQDREFSMDSRIRQKAHFEGYLSANDFNHAISYAIDEDDIQSMKSIGYRILEFGNFNWAKVISAFEIYKNIHGNLDIPSDYQVNATIIESDCGFDETFEDLLLGEAATAIRIGDVDALEDPIRKQELDNLGFEWGDSKSYQRYRFVPMLIGLRLYKHLYGFAMPQSDFRVPDEPQWPFWMINMPLGEWAATCRVQQKMVDTQYPDRKDLLDALNFQWWVPPKKSFPSKYYQPLPSLTSSKV